MKPGEFVMDPLDASNPVFAREGLMRRLAMVWIFRPPCGKSQES
jgi:hypothetical protein